MVLLVAIWNPTGPVELPLVGVLFISISNNVGTMSQHTVVP